MRRNLLITLIVLIGLTITMAACDLLGTENIETLRQKAAEAKGGSGIVFYYSATGFTMADTGEVCHYLEAAPYDAARGITWASSGNYDTDIAGTGTAIGTGRKNTALILATDANAPAAKACREYRGGGKSDWFLPSKDELNLLYENRATVGNMKDYWYWSSSQGGNGVNHAWGQYFANGDQSDDGKYASFVRAIRAF